MSAAEKNKIQIELLSEKDFQIKDILEATKLDLCLDVRLGSSQQGLQSTSLNSELNESSILYKNNTNDNHQEEGHHHSSKKQS